ncbi:MAG: ABC transporter ATP-binding protein [Planctomycetes bacterium]|nr:ABC transporter ATP-binding protein [Planctomycetota bacterium]
MRLVARGLKKRYPGLEVLAGVDLDVQVGEVVAIRGASGTGKSTLLHLLGLLDPPDAGTVSLDGVELTALTASKRAAIRAQRIGFVFQAFNLLPEFTVLENVHMSARTARLPLGPSRDHAMDLLTRVGLGGRGDSSISTLSGGERQRVALCRALLPRPALILADEPTGNLDPATATVVLQQVLDLARVDGSSVILVTHDPAIAERADRRLELRAGGLHPE